MRLDEEHVVLFIGITHDFIILKNEVCDYFEAIISNPNAYLSTHPFAIEQLISLGLIVEDSFDEFDILKQQRDSYTKSKIYKTSIISTFDCNYSCWYCKQEHKPLAEAEIRTDLIIKHVKKYLIENDIKEYVISWFGGEPLMQPSTIRIISSELKRFCEDNNIIFTGGITTNGALLTPGIAKLLVENGIVGYQIAIDGDRVTHNKNKADIRSKSSFDLILGNIVHLVSTYPQTEVVLRLNYTPAMLKSASLVNDICDIIPQNIRSRITIDLQRIWQIDELSYDINLMNILQKKLISAGFKISTQNIFSICYVAMIR